jgi:hypothetical protein
MPGAEWHQVGWSFGFDGKFDGMQFLCFSKSANFRRFSKAIDHRVGMKTAWLAISKCGVLIQRLFYLR